jgi:hypothetical protein
VNGLNGWVWFLILALISLPGRAAPAGVAARSSADESDAPRAADSSSPSETPRAAVERLVADYIELYSGPTLDRWKTLFHPAARVAFPEPDGSIRTRDLAEFVARQEAYFASGRRISERLEHVRIDMGRRIARVSADFIFIDEGEERPGQLGLHLVADRGGWKIVAVLFSYDAE